MPTISYDPLERPGVSNLLTILAACDGSPGAGSAEELSKNYSQKNHADLKQDVAEAIENLISPIRERYLQLQNDPGYLVEVSEQGSEKARAIARRSMAEVKRAVGLDALRLK